jgi:transcriptional regulator with XRE-family HTH domain
MGKNLRTRDKNNPYAADIFRLRSMLGLTQAEFAEKIGMSLRGLQSIEYGFTRVPDFETMKRIAELCQVELISIGSGTGPQKSKPVPISVHKAESLISIFSIAPTLNESQLDVVSDCIAGIRDIDAATQGAADTASGKIKRTQGKN